MSEQDDYCELCDLRKSQCIHGMPKPVVEPEAPRVPTAPKARKAAPRKSASSPTSAVATRRAPRKWTPPTEFVQHIVAVLEDAGGSLPAEDALARIEERVSDQLRPGDHEKSPQGDLRWRTAARKARRELVEAGVVSADRPGIWELKG
ncbi:MAG: hypothetical protein L0H93_07405 [Nocardioides sp.]|nr:hypothetical protein [Nocardioides sp.]